MEKDNLVHLDQCNDTDALQKYFTKQYPHKNSEDLAVMVRNAR